MKYEQGREESAEVLRLLIPKMAEHPAAFTPLSYAVWYEHTTGINPELSATLGNLLTRGEKLDDHAILKLYECHVSESDIQLERALRDEIRQLLQRLATSTSETGNQANKFGNDLQAYSNTLKHDLDAPKLISLINTMSGDTANMLNTMQKLQGELADSKQKVESLHQELQSARVEALIDPLTHIFNRRGFEAKAAQTFANREAGQKGPSLLMVDIDHFKKINDTYGHLFGDRVICGVAETLKSKVRGQDLVARMGGEEFAVLLEDTDIAGALVVAEQIRQTIERCTVYRVGTQEKVGGITLSVGVSIWSDGSSLLSLLDQADKALYSSKQSGRNRTSVFK